MPAQKPEIMQNFAFVPGGEEEPACLIRSKIVNDHPWFIAKDVCAALEIVNHRDAVSKLDEDEKGDVVLTDAIGREQQTLAVNESGLYALIMNSRKKSAKRFRKWVTSEVLPSIRRTGAYAIPTAPAAEMETRLQALEKRLDTTATELKNRADDQICVLTAVLHQFATTQNNRVTRLERRGLDDIPTFLQILRSRF